MVFSPYVSIQIQSIHISKVYLLDVFYIDFKSPATRQWVPKYNALVSVTLILDISNIFSWTRFLQWLFQSALYYESNRVDSAYTNSTISAFFEAAGYIQDPLLGCPRSVGGSIRTFSNIITCVQYLQKTYPDQIISAYKGANTIQAGKELGSVTVEEGVFVLFFSFIIKSLVLEYLCSPVSKEEV